MKDILIIIIFSTIILNTTVDASNTTDVQETAVIISNTIAIGESYAAVITENGELWAWEHIWNAPPIMVMQDVAAVYANRHEVYAVRTDGSMWGWYLHGISMGIMSGVEPEKVMDNVAHVSVGHNGHVLVIDTDGLLWAFGHNNRGQLGDGTTTQRMQPVIIMDDVVMASAGYHHSAAIRSDGSVWTWGDNQSGQLGDGTRNSQLSPIKVMENVAYVSAGDIATVVIKTDGSMWGWGLFAETATPNDPDVDPVDPWGRAYYIIRTPAYPPHLIAENVRAVSRGHRHMVAIKDDGSLWAWGENHSNSNHQEPVHIMEDAVAITTFIRRTLAATADGRLWFWQWGEEDFPKQVLIEGSVKIQPKQGN